MFKCPKDQVFANLQTLPTTTYCKVPSVTYLGVSISSNLFWTAHVDSVCSKAKRQVGLLHKHFHNASPFCKNQLYKSLVLLTALPFGIPTMPFVSTNWNLSKKLQPGLSPGDGLTTMTPCSATSIGQSCAPEQKLLLCNRILNNCSMFTPALFTPHPSPHLRHNHPFALYYPTCHSTTHLTSFTISVVPLWNCLPTDVVCAPSLYSF